MLNQKVSLQQLLGGMVVAFVLVGIIRNDQSQQASRNQINSSVPSRTSSSVQMAEPQTTPTASVSATAIPSSNYSEKPVEYKLAVLDNGGEVSEDDPRIARFRSLLSQLTATYVENEKQIGDCTVAAQEILKRKGVTESLQSIMEGMNRVLPEKIGNQKYTEYTAAYCTLRDKGQSHDEAVNELSQMIQSIAHPN